MSSKPPVPSPSLWSEWPAPAKLNLFLHIVGRRRDGYHLLQTVFQLLNWGDSVSIRTRQDGLLVRTNAIVGVAPENDLCLRAARLLQARTNTSLGADIAVDKRIPIGGGLGGGSSDAATVLLGLNVLWRTELDVDALAKLGLQLGADVPVFVRGRSAWAEGIGEQLTELDLPQRHFVILDPRVSVPTHELFQSPQLTRNTPATTIPHFISGQLTANAFAPIVRERFAAVDAALNWLGQFGLACLSGSGGCVFVGVADRDSAVAIAAQCPPEFVAHVAQGVNLSPLLAAKERFSSD